jgi:hypothetical protein
MLNGGAPVAFDGEQKKSRCANVVARRTVYFAFAES